jgi:hypothetical protein
MKKLLPISEIWRKFMRITITQLLLCVLCGSITFAHDTQAQGVLNRNITIVGEKIELKNVLSQIEKQAEIKFVYSTKIKSDLRLSLNYTNRKLSVVLNEILKPNLIDYEVIEDRILLKKSKTEQGFSPNEEKVESATKVATEMTVRGVVTDEKYEPIIGASVKSKVQ